MLGLSTQISNTNQYTNSRIAETMFVNSIWGSGFEGNYKEGLYSEF